MRSILPAILDFQSFNHSYRILLSFPNPVDKVLQSVIFVSEARKKAVVIHPLTINDWTLGVKFHWPMLWTFRYVDLWNPSFSGRMNISCLWYLPKWYLCDKIPSFADNLMNQYLGCYDDNVTSRDVGIGSGEIVGHPMTIQDCITRCDELQYSISAVQVEIWRYDNL